MKKGQLEIQSFHHSGTKGMKTGCISAAEVIPGIGDPFACRDNTAAL